MTQVRPYRASDLEALYDICLKTGEAGEDATALYADPRILGEIYAAPYGVLEPALAFVAQDEAGVAGYIVGAADTRAFETRCEVEWWPGRRALYADPRQVTPTAWTPDQQRAFQIHRPFATPEAVVEAAPAHLHINLLPRLQGQGVGRVLMDAWLHAVRAAGAPRAHLGCHAKNQRALRFYDAYGFARMPPQNHPDTVWMSIDT